MAHTCPECGSYCTCNGDISDCCHDFDEDVNACVCCADEYENEPCECEEMVYARACAATAEAQCAAMREVISECVKWFDTSEVQGSFQFSWLHGIRVSEDFSQWAETTCNNARQALSPDSGKALLEERDLYKRAFEEVCRQFNYGDEKDFETMRDSFLSLAKEAHHE